MKKVISLLLIFALCFSLAACDEGNVSNNPASQENPSNNAAAVPDENRGTTTTQEDGEEADYEFVEPTTVQVETGEDGTRYTYYMDANGMLMRAIIVPADGSTSETTFGKNGQPIHSIGTMPDGSEYETTYGKNGQPIHNFYKWIDGTEEDQRYNENGQLISLIYKFPDGSSVEQHYDSYFENGNPGKITYIDLYGERTEEYDEQGNLIYASHKLSDGEHAEEQYENGSLICRTSTLPSGNQIERHYENGAEIKYVEHTYNEAGILIQTVIQDRKTNVNEYWDYNDEGVLIAYTYSLYPTVNKVYYFDESGALIQFNDNGTIINDPEELAKIAADLDF